MHASSGVIGKVLKAGERRALRRLDRRLRVRPEQLVAAASEPLDSVPTLDAVKVADAPPPVDQVEQGLAHHLSQWTMLSSGIRSAGLNSPPVLNPMVRRAACV